MVPYLYSVCLWSCLHAKKAFMCLEWRNTTSIRLTVRLGLLLLLLLLLKPLLLLLLLLLFLQFVGGFGRLYWGQNGGFEKCEYDQRMSIIEPVCSTPLICSSFSLSLSLSFRGFQRRPEPARRATRKCPTRSDKCDAAPA